MSRFKQSRRTQRALERELFGSEPRAKRRHSVKLLQAHEPLPGVPGRCWHCGDCCWPAYEPWTCPTCSVTYPVATVQA